MEGTTQSPCIFCLINNIADMLTKEQHNEIDELVALYISGEASREILDELMRRARESDAARRYIREQLELNFSASVAGSCSDVDEIAAYKRFLKRVDRKKRKLRLTWNSRWMMRVAAVILIVLLPMWAYYQGGGDCEGCFFRYCGGSSQRFAYQTLFARWYISVAQCEFTHCLFSGLWRERPETDTSG